MPKKAVDNEIDITVEDDGTVTFSVDGKIDKEFHDTAEQFMDEVITDLGGEHEIVSRKPHSHDHGHVHIDHTHKQKA